MNHPKNQVSRKATLGGFLTGSLRGGDSSERGVISTTELRQPGIFAVYIVMGLFLLMLAVTTLFPLYWMYTGSVKSSLEIIELPPTFFPRQWNFSNFPAAWTSLNYSRYFTNTVILAMSALALQFVVSATAAFALSKLDLRGKKLLLAFFLSTLMVPAATYLIPQYLTIVKLPLLGFGIIDTWWAVLLPGAVSPFNIFVLKSFFDDIPKDLHEAAKIDGAGPLMVFVRIIIPLSTSALGVVAIFTVIGVWKDFFWPFLVLSSADKQPIMVAIYRLLNKSVSEPLNLQIAGLAIASTPPILMFLLFQRQIVQGISLSGIKG